MYVLIKASKERNDRPIEISCKNGSFEDLRSEIISDMFGEMNSGINLDLSQYEESKKYLIRAIKNREDIPYSSSRSFNLHFNEENRFVVIQHSAAAKMNMQVNQL